MAKKVSESKSNAEKVQLSVTRVINQIDKIVGAVPNVNEVLSGLTKEITSIKEDLTLGMKEFELNMQVKTKALEDAYSIKEEELVKVHEQNIANNSVTAAKLNEDLAILKAKLDKDKEELIYQSKIAIERTNEQTAIAIGNKLGKILVFETDFKDLNEKATTNFAKSEADIKAIENKAKSEVYASEASKYKDLQNQTSSKIALLEKELELANNQLISAKAEIVYFKDQLAKVPAQISSAVEAAKTSVITNVSSDKK